MNLRRPVAIACIAAAFITACGGAQPANLPTSTPLAATATSAAIPASATPRPPTPQGGAAAANAAPATKAAPGANASAPTANVPDGPRPYAQLAPAQRSAINSGPPPMAIDVTRKYVATISTSKGVIVVELDPSAAPLTVNNFVHLANNGFYDGLTFHRVEPNFVIQGGDPLGNGGGGPGYNIPPEIKLPHVDGAIAMARQGGDPATTPSSGSQFYITMGPQAFLDGNYTAFGRTTAGLDIVRKIAVGDRIERIDVAEANGLPVAVAASWPTAVPTLTPVPPPAVCEGIVTNVGAADHVKGAKAAKVTIIEYADLQCPACAAAHTQLNTVLSAMSDTVRIVYRHFPLITIHDKALIAARGAEAAALQGKFFEFVDAMYAKQSEWDKTPAAEITKTLTGFATQIGLDTSKFAADLSSEAVVKRVQRDVDSGVRLKLQGTPSFYVDGRALPAEAFADPGFMQQLQSYAAARPAPQAGGTPLVFEAPTKVVEDGAVYELTITTSKGDIVAELDSKIAPVNVNAVVFLAQKGYFDKAPIMQNVAQFNVAVGGTANSNGNPGFACTGEAAASNFSKGPTLALNIDPPPASQNRMEFVFVYAPSDQLNGQLTALGPITAGADIARSLQGAQGETKADEILKVTVKKK